MHSKPFILLLYVLFCGSMNLMGQDVFYFQGHPSELHAHDLQDSLMKSYSGDISRIQYFATQLLDESSAANQVFLMARANHDLGDLAYYEGDLHVAHDHYTKAKILHSQNASVRALAACYRRLISIDFEMAQYDEGMAHMEDYLNESLEMGALVQESWFNRELAAMYSFLGVYDEAHRFLGNALGIAQSENDELELAKCYLQYGKIYLNKKDLEQSLFYLTKAKEVFKRRPHQEQFLYRCRYYTALGYLKKSNNVEAIRQLRKMEWEDDSERGALWNSRRFAAMGEAYLDLGEREKAMDMTQKAISYISEENILNEQYKHLQLLGTIYELKGAYKKALDIEKRLNKFRSDAYKTVGLQRLKHVGSTLDNYQNEQLKMQLAQTALLEDERRFQLRFIGGGLLIILLISIFIVLNLLQANRHNSQVTNELEKFGHKNEK